MHIVDSQLHLWGANTPQRPWPPGRERDAQRPYPISKDTLLFDHAGLPIHEKAPKVLEDLPLVCALAKHSNVAVKVSGLPVLSAQAFPFRDVQDIVQRLFDAFGPRRTFWGTDLTRMPCTYRECIDMFTKELPGLKADDLEWVMGRGVCEWLGWPL